MPNPESIRTLGWKFFFGLLMLFQVVALAVIWRTYDAISIVRAESALTTYKVDAVLFPEMREQKVQLEALRRGMSKP